MSARYEEIVRRYARGDRERAVTEASRLVEDELHDEQQALDKLARWARGCRVCEATMSWRAAPLEAAILLHTDCAREALLGAAAAIHESHAAALADLLRQDAQRAGFASRWYAVMAGLAVGENRFDDGLRWAERGLEAFPAAAELWLAKGAIQEASVIGLPIDLGAAAFHPSAQQMRRNLDDAREARRRLEGAAQSLGKALAASPELDEARLRLGRVASRLGRGEAARAALEQVLARTPQRDTAYLAHLFLGGVHEDAARLDEAARSYDAALALVPDSQAARIARSHLRARLADAAAARADVELALGRAGRRPNDPFWDYPWGPSVRVEQRLSELRREVAP